MKSMRSKLTGCLVMMGALLVGCQGAMTEEELATESGLQMSVVSQAAEEEPRMAEDIIGGLEHEAGVLHAEEKSAGVVLDQLKARQVATGVFEATDELTGNTTRFSLKLYPWDSFLRLWKYCPATNEWIFYWLTCPVKIVDTGTTRIWKNSSCGRKVQSAGWGACVNTSSGGSNRYYYLEAWKCSVGTGYCVERYAAKTMRFNYDLAACNPNMLLSAYTTSYDFLCKAKAPVICQ
jgi:hypothetical protein